jgi:pyrroloquinoline quinone (PQQ) biosynthesis protein C
VGSYYYLAAQLPYLIYGQSLPMSPAAFKELARNAMSPEEGAVLDACVLDPAAPPVTSGFLGAWREWEGALRLNLARLRAARLKREAPDAPEFPVTAAAAAKAAVAIESPLDAEIFLDRARWSAIESLQGINYFSENTIYAYLLKLLLMERRQAFKTEEGFEEYKTLYASILEQAGESK